MSFLGEEMLENNDPEEEVMACFPIRPFVRGCFFPPFSIDTNGHFKPESCNPRDSYNRMATIRNVRRLQRGNLRSLQK